MKQRQCWYVCDVCEEAESPAEVTFTRAATAARREGWSIMPSRDRHVCPECRR